MLNEKEKEVYERCGFNLHKLKVELEGKSYNAAIFQLNNFNIIYRKGKVTPKKAGQFVTFWKRNEKGITVPFHENDVFDFFVVSVHQTDRLGHFVFPKNILIKYGILSTNIKDGKRGFRVYSIWDKVNSRQAAKTQEWQNDYFVELKDAIDCKELHRLYTIK